MDIEDGEFYEKDGSLHVFDRTVYATAGRFHQKDGRSIPQMKFSLCRIEQSMKNKDRRISRIAEWRGQTALSFAQAESCQNRRAGFGLIAAWLFHAVFPAQIPMLNVYACQHPAYRQIRTPFTQRHAGTTTTGGLGATTTTGGLGATTTTGGLGATTTAPLGPAQPALYTPRAQTTACASETLDSSKNTAPHIARMVFILISLSVVVKPTHFPPRAPGR